MDGVGEEPSPSAVIPRPARPVFDFDFDFLFDSASACGAAAVVGAEEEDRSSRAILKIQNLMKIFKNGKMQSKERKTHVSARVKISKMEFLLETGRAKGI